MLSRLGLLFIGLASALATPMDHRLEDIQCRCLSLSTSAKPTLCTYLESRGLDWPTAYSLASENDMKIQFASQDTISKVLAIPKPLPSNVLESLSHGEAKQPSTKDLVKTQNRIVCGLGDEVKYMGSTEIKLDLECHYVGAIAGIFMLFLIFYAVAAHVWARNFGSSEGTIKLEGNEKALTAELDGTTPTQIS